MMPVAIPGEFAGASFVIFRPISIPIPGEFAGASLKHAMLLDVLPCELSDPRRIRRGLIEALAEDLRREPDDLARSPANSPGPH